MCAGDTINYNNESIFVAMQINYLGPCLIAQVCVQAQQEAYGQTRLHIYKIAIKSKVKRATIKMKEIFQTAIKHTKR